MSLDFGFTKIKDWARTCFIGLTEMPEGEDIDDWAGGSSDWFKPTKESSEELQAVAKEEGWILCHQHPSVKALIFLGMVFQPKGGGGINERNVDAWIERVGIWQEVSGPLGSRFSQEQVQHARFENHMTHWVDEYIDADFIRKVVGLSTNCSSVTEAEFRKALYNQLRDHARSRARAASAKKEPVTA